MITSDIKALIEAYADDGELSPRASDALKRGRLQTMTVDASIDGQLMVLQLAADGDGGLIVESVEFLQNAGGGS